MLLQDVDNIFCVSMENSKTGSVSVAWLTAIL